jgi:aryl-phospho-beta-D-glucosidase BglC (GH1 family)
MNIIIRLMIIISLHFLIIPSYFVASAAQQNQIDEKIPYVGVNVRGYYTSLQNIRYSTPFPEHYYDDSFKLISKAGMNHIRYVFYWEAYDKNP